MKASLAAVAGLWLTASLLASGPPVPDHSPWNTLLGRYVNGSSRVDYSGWRREGLDALDGYVAALAAPGGPLAAAERKALLINAYNALMIRWILAQYPVASVLDTPAPFQSPRHTVAGRRVSLEAIEAELREMGDPRIHAALVCASRGCPPLRNEAYAAGRLDEQLDDNTRRWLADRRLNEFDPEARMASVSPIFQWYAADFARSGGLERFLASHAPAGQREFLTRPGARIEYKAYDWGLNDSGSMGDGYGGWRFYRDVAWNQPEFARPAAAIVVSLGGLLWWIARRRKARRA